MTSENFLTLSQAADQAGISKPTLRKWLEAGKIPGATTEAKGNRKDWRIPLTELLAAVDQANRNSPAAKAKAKADRTEALEADYDRLLSELNHAKELLARTERELEDYRQRERQMFLVIETRQAQEQRRFRWFGR